MGELFRRIDAFWARHPALFLGVSFFLGTSLFLSFHKYSLFDFFLIPILVILFPRKRLLFGLSLMAVAAFTASLRVTVPIEPINCNGILTAEVVDRSFVSYHGRQTCKTALAVRDFRSFDGKRLAKGFVTPVSVPLTCSLVGGKIYQFNTRLIVDESLKSMFRPYFPKNVQPIGTVFSCVEWRLQLRKMLEKLFVVLFPDPEIRQVAGGLTFGLYKDPLLQQAMHRVGVEHVLAVSGFHFGIVAALTVFLAHGLAPKKRAVVAMVLLTAYLFIIGPLPSVLRAWCAAIVVLGGICLDRRASGLNCLGVGLIVSVFYDPVSISGIGYQLSFLATAAILFFSRPCLNLLRRVVCSRRVAEVVCFSKTDQILMGALEWFMPAVSLLLPVFIVVCPFQLAFLQDFSLLGLVYNLLIPALFSLAMPAVLLAVVFYPIPVIPHLFAWFASFPLQLGLMCIENAPETSWSLVSGEVVSQSAGRIILFLIFFGGITYRGWADLERIDSWKACL